MSESSVKSARDAMLTPRPPSPYKPGKVSLRAKKSVLPALFDFKLDGPRRRDKKLLLFRDAERRMEEKYQKSIPVGCTSKLSQGGKAAVESESAPAAAAPEVAGEEKAEQQKQYSNADVVMREYFFIEAQQEQVISEEQSERNVILSEEEYGFTTLLVDFLQFLPQVIAYDSPYLVEEAKRDELARTEAREAFFNQIAATISERFREEKHKEKRAEYSKELFSSHAEGLEELKAKEAVQWEELMEWNKKRLLRFGQAVKQEDYRLRHLKKRKLVRGKPVVTLGERYLQQLKDRNKEGQLVIYDGDAYTRAHEALFALVGRQAFANEKEIRKALDRLERALDTLMEEEVEAREEVQRLESVAWVPVLLHGVDGFYEAKRATRDREEEEALEAMADANDEVAMAKIKYKMLARKFESKEVESSPWSPDVSPAADAEAEN